jgi:hypothetical protein
MKYALISSLIVALLSQASVFAQTNSYLFDQDFVNGTQLIILADYHYDTGENALYPSLLDTLSKNSVKPDCLFLEHPQDLQVLIESFQRNEISWPSYSEKSVSIFFSKYDKNFQLQHPEVDFDYNKGLSFFSNKAAIANKALKNGLKIFAVDSVTSVNITASDDDRNLVMSKKIKDLFDSKQCHQALFPVGNAHFGIADLLNAQKIVSKSYDFDREGTRVFFVCDSQSCDWPKSSGTNPQ